LLKKWEEEPSRESDVFETDSPALVDNDHILVALLNTIEG